MSSERWIPWMRPLGWCPLLLAGLFSAWSLEAQTEGEGPGEEESVAAASAQDLPFTMRIGARIQVRYLSDRSSETNTVFIRRGRLSLAGEGYERFRYAVQVGLAGEGARLLDANVQARLGPVILWLGQGKARFGRQWITSSASLNFVDRTVVSDRFSAGRQQGVALSGRLADDRLEYGVGLYNGDGINRSVNRNDRFMKVARVVFTPLGAYAPEESAHDRPEDPRVAVGLSGLRNTEGEGAEGVRVTRVNGEAAFKVGGLNLTGEAYREWADPRGIAERVTRGWYVQAGYLFPGGVHEAAVRYAPITGDSPMDPDLRETGVAYSHYFQEHRAKVQADLRNIRNRITGEDHRELRVQFQLAL